MVTKYEAYQIVNNAILRVANDVVPLDILETDDKKYQVRMEEAPFSLTEKRERVDGVVVVGHNLSQYINKFYSITLESDTVLPIDYLINASNQKIDLTEFGEF